MVLDLPAGARSVAMGSAFVLEPGDPDAVFHQSGLLDRARGLRGSVRTFTPSGILTTLSAGQDWFGGGVALGLQHLAYQVADDVVESVDAIRDLPADEASLREAGDRTVSEIAVSAGYGRGLWGAHAGAVGKWVEQRLGFRRGRTVALDLGLAFSPGPLTMGLSVQNLGPSMKMEGGRIPLPTRFTMGASSREAPVGPIDISGSCALSYRLDGELVPALGVEVGYWPVTGRTFVGRVGYRYLPGEFSAVPLSFGGAFLGDDIVLEYAYQGYDRGSPSHSFGVGWR